MEWSNKIGVFTKTQGTKQQAIQKTPLVFMIYLPLIKSGPRGESNSRPNEETICFLHAYLCLRFSSISKTKATNLCLIS